MKPITKQLAVAALILTFVTVLSLGIRQVRFGANRDDTIKSPVITDTEPEHGPVDAEPDPQHADAAESYEEAPTEDYSEVKLSKGAYAKAKGSKGLQKIPMGDNANLYITEKGETWYVGKGPDGETSKVRVEIDDATGEMTVVERAGKSGGLQRISMGGNDNIYITAEGQTWYVTEGSKSRVEIDDDTGEITVLEQFGGGDGGK